MNTRCVEYEKRNDGEKREFPIGQESKKYRCAVLLWRKKMRNGIIYPGCSNRLAF